MSPGRSGAIWCAVTPRRPPACRARAQSTAGCRPRDVVAVPAGRDLVQLLEFAEADGLRHAVLGDREVLGRQPFDRLAVLVLHGDGLDHQLRVGLELDDAVGGRAAAARLRRAGACCAPASSTKISAREMAFMLRTSTAGSPAGCASDWPSSAGRTARCSQPCSSSDTSRDSARWWNRSGSRDSPRTSAPSDAFSDELRRPTIEFLPAVPHCPGRRGVRRRIQVPSLRRRLHRKPGGSGRSGPGHARALHRRRNRSASAAARCPS